jgi:hypothetical protein
MMLVGAGVDTIFQKATTGKVDVGQVILSGALGGFGGAGIAARAGFTGLKATAVAGVSSGGISGGIQGTYGYYAGPGPHTVPGAIAAAGQGAAFGSVTGGAGSVAGTYAARGLMRPLTHNASSSTVAMGRWMDGRVIPYADANGFGYYKGTPGWIHNPMANLVQRADENSIAHKVLGGAMNSVDENFNRAWINTQVNSGKRIVDIGVDLDSPFYQIERHAVAGYSGYSRDFQPNADLRVLQAANRP